MIRRAKNTDIDRLNVLLYQVQQLHADGRPDIFKNGAKKYTTEELKGIIADDMTPIFVYEEDGMVMGYAFCIYQITLESEQLHARKVLYIDDLCVDENCRGRHVGQQLFEYVKKEARDMGCHHLTLNVWEGNDSARSFYDRQGLQIQKTVMEMILDEE